QPEPEAPAPGNETQVAMPDWVLDDEEEKAEEVEPYSIADAHARGKACKNLGELRELFKEFHRQIQAGKADPDTLTAIGEYSARLRLLRTPDPARTGSRGSSEMRTATRPSG